MNMNEYTVPLSNTATTLDIIDTIGRSEMSDIEAYIGYTDEDIAGIEADFENNTFTRLAGAIGKSGGSDFNSFPTYAGMRRCNLADDGTVNAYYGDAGYVEDGSNGQVMVEIPRFYYKVVPLKLQKNTDSTGAMGYHLLKARYYISSTPKDGFKVHPLFHIGNRVINKAYISAYEGCIYDVSAGVYLQEDEQVADFTETTGDKLSSIAGVIPCSGKGQNLTRMISNRIAQNRGIGWYNVNIQAVSAIQLLHAIEYACFNWQATLGAGVTNITDDRLKNCASFTGSTASLGNASGRATSTIDYTGTAQTDESKTSVSYRGVENFYGNIWSWVEGVNIYGDGTNACGIPYICTDYNFAEDKNTGNYLSCGFTLLDSTGSYYKYFGYSNKVFDWLFLPSKKGGNSLTPVGDANYSLININGYTILMHGGRWIQQNGAGGYSYGSDITSTYRGRVVGGRLIYLPQ